MKKVIKIGGDDYVVNYSPEIAVKVLDTILKWMEQKSHYASSSGEGIMQDDDCQIDAPVLISDIVDDILTPEFREQ